MKILITNDDGVMSPVLPRLIKWAQKYGEVTTVAPKTNQSATSHAIDFTRPIEIKKIQLTPEISAYSMDSTPADCVRFAYLGLKERYDLVISGINKGLNVGKDIVYSGTVGAVFEAARLDMKAVAISTDPATFDVAVNALDELAEFFITNKLFDICPLYNVNIPIERKEIKFTRQGGIFFTDEFVYKGNDMFVQEGEILNTGSQDLNYDTNAVNNGYISITPLTAERTDLSALNIIRNNL